MQRRPLAPCLWILLAVLTLYSGLVLDAQAQDAPPYLTHQGRLFGADNVALSGPQTLTFRVYDTADDTGVELWAETLDVTTANGYYSAVLGQTSALPDTVFDGSTRYLGVTVGDATVVDELTPRLEVTSVAYALKSSVAENAVGDLTPTSIQVGGADIASDGTITLGAATINTDGSIVVGNTTIGADGAISVAGNPVIGADGAVDASAFAGTTLSDLEAGGCTTGQLPQFDAVGGWGCITPAAGTAYSAGAGLTLDAADTFSVDPTQVQTRLSGACNPGEFMLGANEDGSVNCALEHTYTGGAGVVVTTVGDSSTIAVDFGVAQQRVTGACAPGEAIQTISADGSVTCETDSDTQYAAGAGIDISAGTISLVDTVDDDTTYTAGTGIDISGTTISLVDTVDDDTTYSAGAGIDISGTTISLLDPTDDDTTYTAGSGLTLTGTTFAVNAAAIQTRVTGTCAAGEKLLGINADGSVTCAADANTDTTYTAGTGLALAGTTFAINDAIVHTDAEAATHAGTVDAHHTRYTNTEARSAVDAADILAKLLGVDGTGSGVDADTLDGLDSELLYPRGSAIGKPAASCQDALTAGMGQSGRTWVIVDGAPAEIYCEQELNGGGWALLQNSVTGVNTTEFWRIPYAERFDERGVPSPSSNYYHGGLYRVGAAEYMDVYEDRHGKIAVAFVASADSIDEPSMRFNNPALISGEATPYGCQFAAGWSSFDFDGDTNPSGNCAADYSNVTQHYCACWNNNLGSDAEAPIYDSGVGPHVVSSVTNALGLENDGTAYTRVRRITRYVRW